MAITKLNPTWPVLETSYPNRLGRFLERSFGGN